MIKFSKEKVLLLHKLIAQETGGSIGVRDEALLDSALENAFAGFGGQEFYPTKEEKGARLGYAKILSDSWARGEITGEQMKAALLASHRKMAAQVQSHA